VDSQTETLHPVLQDVLTRNDAQIPAERRDALAAFATAYTRRLGDEELAETTADQLFGLVRSTFEFVDGRGSHPSAVRVFDPDPNVDGYGVVGTVIECNVDDTLLLVDSVV